MLIYVVLRKKYVGKDFSEIIFSKEYGHEIRHPGRESNPEPIIATRRMIPILVEAKESTEGDSLRTWFQGKIIPVEQGRKGRKTSTQFRN